MFVPHGYLALHFAEQMSSANILDYMVRQLCTLSTSREQINIDGTVHNPIHLSVNFQLDQ
ncbi:hypothetical protein DPMN_014803 [Dreissena polymorpha]|uniref:Uncharacterized protein n=1 Tax=Dreissena polymorpha TaxID=45954 RepID=A0A9D4S3U7_DREPO|nr:hypothetical protein DPMN_014803 [Dreissena polymorpha]